MDVVKSVGGPPYKCPALFVSNPTLLNQVGYAIFRHTCRWESTFSADVEEAYHPHGLMASSSSACLFCQALPNLNELCCS